LLNAHIHIEVGVLKIVASAASDAELGASYVDSKIGISERRTLEEIGHP